MYVTEFDYHLDDNTLVTVMARCKNILYPNDVTELSLMFFDVEDNIVNVEYNQDLFDELEFLAMAGFTETYYNSNSH